MTPNAASLPKRPIGENDPMKPTRAELVELDGPLCSLCGQGTTRSLTLDIFSGDGKWDAVAEDVANGAYSVRCPYCLAVACWQCLGGPDVDSLMCWRCARSFEVFWNLKRG